MNEQPRIGFIGLGLMGEAFTRRLVECGYSVTVFDIDETKISRATNYGCIGASSATEVTRESDTVMVCVVSTDAVREVVVGDGGILAAGDGSKVLVDHSTTVLRDTRELAEQLLRETGMGWVDAPVSGGPPAARNGTLAVMAGGAERDIECVRAIMTHVASRFTHMGPVGAGQVTKMVNQVLVLNNYCVLAEALALAEAGGIDAAKVPEALETGHAGSNLLKAMFPKMIERDFEPSGFARQVLKDLDMVGDLAKQLKVPTPMSSEATSLYRILVSKGYGELDGVSILKLFDPKDSL